MQRAQEESSKAEILMDSIEIKMDSEHKKTKKAEKSAEHSEHEDTAKSIEFTEQNLAPDEPKKKKRGWWNKLVNTTE